MKPFIDIGIAALIAFGLASFVNSLWPPRPQHVAIEGKFVLRAGPLYHATSLDGVAR